MRTIAALPAAALLAGAAAGLLLSDPPYAACSLLLLIGVAFTLFGWTFKRVAALVCGAGLGFFAGAVLLASVEWQRAWRPPLRLVFEQLARAERAAAAAENRRLPEDDEGFAIVEGTLRSDASVTETGVSLSVAVDKLLGLDGQGPRDGREGQDARLRRDEARASSRAIRGGIVVTVAGALAPAHVLDWRAGRRVRMPVLLRRPPRYLDPGVPDYERALARRGTTLVGSVKSAALVDVLARASPVDEAFAAGRAYARAAIRDAVGRWSRRSAAIVAAIVIGDRAGLDEPLQQRLQDAGTYHVIAISGGNIAILAGLLLGAFRLAGWLGRTAMVTAIATLAAYAKLVGGGASVDRATLMAAIYFGARAIDQRTPPLNALAIVAALLVVFDPLSIADAAFVLTFGATLAILIVVPRATMHDATGVEIPNGNRSIASLVVNTIWSMFLASLAAEAMLFPVSAFIFSRVTFAGLALNFLAIPLMALAQAAGMALVPIALVSPDAAAIAGWCAHAGADGLVRSADLVRFLPLAYRVAPPSPIAIAVYYAAGAAALGTRRSIALVVTLAAALWMLIDPRTILAARGDGRLHVTFIDVGQGDATFVRFPHGATLLIDAGGSASPTGFDFGDRVVAPVVRDAGFPRLDYVALTHGDPDHVGGAPAVIAEFKPREVWEGIPVPRDVRLTTLRLQTQSLPARWANVYAGDRLSVDGVDVSVRHPARADWERQKVRNDDSLVVEIRWRDVSILLTGDIGKAVERSVAAALAPARLRVVKIPHHGSATSSTAEFVAAAGPQIAVASAGRANHFGHPVPEVLDRYRAAGAAVFRTDQDGAVTVESDGWSLNVSTFTGRRLSVR